MSDTSQPEGMAFRTAQAAVVDWILQQILSGQLAPGTRLIQSEIAQRLGVSTTPVREAMREVAAQGLLDGDAHKGLFVHTPSADELLEVYEIRALLEPANMKKAATRISDKTLHAAEQLLERMDVEEDPAIWVQINQKFHAILADASDSRRQNEILRNLRNISSLYVGIFAQQTPDRLVEANEEHRELLDACRSRDPERAAAIVHHHVLQTVEMIRDHLNSEMNRSGREVKELRT